MRLLLSLLLPFLLVGICDAQRNEAARFDKWDRDRSGGLSREEVPGPLRKNFDRADRNGDGVISREEDAAVGRRRAPEKGAGPRVPEPIRALRNLDYAGTENPRQCLDLYLPKQEKSAENKLPLLVFIHGGGWRAGVKESGWNRIRPFVESGKYAAASIGYRLTDEAIWPAQIHDCKAAIRWLRAQAEEYGYDADRIAVWGTSAGGHLVAMLGVSGGVEELEGTIGKHLDVSSDVTCVVNFFGPSELITLNDHPSRIDHLAPDSPESRLVGAPLPTEPEKAANASPITWVSKDDVPSLIVHGTKDELVPYPQSVVFEKKLEEVGVKTVLLTVDGGGHGGGFGPSVSKAVTTFLSHHLLGTGEMVEDSTVSAGEQDFATPLLIRSGELREKESR